MDIHHNSLFMYLDERQREEFTRKARVDFEEAGETLEIRSITHPAYRHELGRLICARADMELRVLAER